MASSRISRNLFWSGLWIYSLATGLASMIFMAWAFYVETTGRGALFIEPNRVLAAGELATVATGMLALFILFLRSLGRSDRFLSRESRFEDVLQHWFHLSRIASWEASRER